MNEKPEEYNTPTNLPDDLEERAERIFKHIETWSNSGNYEYVYPMDGPKDTRLMLDYMGIEVGTIFENRDNREIVVSEGTYQANWTDGKHERPWIETIAFDGDDTRKRTYRMGDGHSIINLWKSYIYDGLTVVGNINEL